MAVPQLASGMNNINEYTVKVTRPIPDSGVREFGQWIVGENWECVKPENNPTGQAIELQKLLNKKLDDIFPTKSVKLSNKDKR